MTLAGAGARRLDPLRWLGWPLVVCLAATVFLSAPIRIFGLPLPEPVFAMVPAFAWAVIRPSMLAPLLLLAFGLFLDLFWGGPAGLWVLALAAAYGLVLAVRPSLTGRGAVMLWIWYGAACLLAFGVGVVVTLSRTGTAPSPFALFWQFLITLLLYPFAHRLIERFEDADVRFR
jgi:rod shape-determining protein MreD